MKNNLLRAIPRADDILVTIMENGDWAYSRNHTLNALRLVLDELRSEILAGNCAAIPSNAAIAQMVEGKLVSKSSMSLRPVVNGTGVVLHTNIGRSVLSERAAKAVYDIARQYNNIELNLASGKRGSRYDHIEPLLCEVTGCEGAMAVNNNAAAVMLVLSTMAKGKEVIVSRGELVEIGGSFRIPEIISLSGCKLVEVGTTNKTHLADYENAINENTALLLKIHPSNFSITGFTTSVTVEELAPLAKKMGLPIVHDIGSGSLMSGGQLGEEPTVPESIMHGADVVTFSGDKLLGAAQAGVIVGKKEYVQACKKNQLTRALRIDKLTAAGLEATLRQYLDAENARKEIPALSLLLLTAEELKPRAEKLMAMIAERGCQCGLEVVAEQSKVGGGSLPDRVIDSYCVAITPEKISTDQFETRLRRLEVPVIARISKDRLLLDLRTIFEYQLEMTANSVAEALKEE